MNIQGDSEGMVNILGGESICHLILNDYRDFAL